MTRIRRPAIIALLALACLQAGDQLAIASDPTALSLTIYNNDLAMVSESRTATIEQPGRVTLMYRGVPSTIDTSSVLATFAQPATLYSQNYSYDVVSYASLLKYHLGKLVNYTEDKESRERKEGTLLATDPILVQPAKDNRKGAILVPHKIYFPSIPEAMAVKPSLFWHLQTQASRLDIALKYLTRGLSWQSDYTLELIDDTHLNLNAWITIANNSGATYQDARITVLAGEINLPSAPQIHKRNRTREMLVMSMADQNIQNEAFSGYHIYKIPFRETIKDKEHKQISFIHKDSIEYERYAYNSERFSWDNFGERTLQFDQIIAFKNEASNQLGMPLPEGTARVYQADDEGVLRFSGADRVKNTPDKEQVKLAIGKYFDVIGKEKVTSYRSTTRERQIRYTLTLSNRSKKPEVIKLDKIVPINTGALHIEDSCTSPCRKESRNAFEARYIIPLEPGKEYEMTISYDLKHH
jgi:hypothetical protein